MSERIEVYSKENCVMCNATYRALGKAGIEYTLLMLEDHPDKIDEFKEAGLMQAPVVVTENDTWSGFRPDKIKELKDAGL